MCPLKVPSTRLVYQVRNASIHIEPCVRKQAKTNKKGPTTSTIPLVTSFEARLMTKFLLKMLTTTKPTKTI